VLKKLPCDVFLGAHGEYHGMRAKYDRLKKGDANPFIDPKGYQAYVAEKEKVFLAKLAEQKAAEAKSPDGPAR
jgi:metallo-beta-lactamase class B